MPTTSKLTAEKALLIRAAGDIAPKIVAAGIGGLSATTLIALASTFHIVLTPGVASLITGLVAVVCGYIKSDTPILGVLAEAKSKAEKVKVPVVEQAVADDAVATLEAHFAPKGATSLAPDQVATP